MRIVVMSDSHGANQKLFDIIEMHLDDADLFIFLGDGEKDFEYATYLYPEMKYYQVAGNCDFGSELPAYDEIKFDGKTVFFSHGHPFYVKYGYSDIISEAQRRGANICLFGHTHNQHSLKQDGIYVMNPGSVREGFYGMIDIVNGHIIMIDCKI